MHTGSCLCGQVRFEIDGPLAPIQVCHCGQCRKAQGGPFAANLPVDASAFRIVQGRSALKSFSASPGKERMFCGECGSPLFSRRQSVPGVVRVRAGLIDTPLATRPALHFYTASRCDWWAITDDLPQYPEDYPPRPEPA